MAKKKAAVVQAPPMKPKGPQYEVTVAMLPQTAQDTELWWETPLDRALKHNGGGLRNRLGKTLEQSQPKFVHITEERNVGRGKKKQTITICNIVHRGENRDKWNVLASGVAIQSPQDEHNEEIGNSLAMSRAVRSLVAKRRGILK